jgi:type IV pilus assembly protein PilA
MLQKLRERMGREEGFTLIELLVVMLILGLLAAIAIPSFINQRNKAQDADAKADARTAQTAIETWATDHGGLYNDGGGPSGADLITIEPTLNGSGVAVSNLSATGYRVTTTSDTTNTFWIIRNANGTFTYDCATRNDDGCPSDGDWAN